MIEADTILVAGGRALPVCVAAECIAWLAVDALVFDRRRCASGGEMVCPPCGLSLGLVVFGTVVVGGSGGGGLWLARWFAWLEAVDPIPRALALAEHKN